MKHKLKKILQLVFALLITSVFCASLVYAVDPKITNKKTIAINQSYTWYDGDRQRTVWLNPRLVAEFNPQRDRPSRLKEAYPSAQELITQKRSIRLWNLGNVISARDAVRNLRSTNGSEKYSSVLHDAPSSAGPMRSLPGNIIIHLEPRWTKGQVASWVEDNKLEIVRELEIGPNILLIKTNPGLESINVANTVYGLDGVVAAYPDWWKELVAR